MLIYLLSNKVNGKYYVGKTVSRNLNSYLSVKRWAVKNGNPSHMPVVNAIAKYGYDQFDVSILTTATHKEELAHLEHLWIVALNATNPEVGYNLCVGGLGASRPCSEATKRKIGNANRGRKPVGYKRTEAHRQQLRDRMKGNCIGQKITPEIVRRWRANETPEQKAKRSAGIQAAWDRRKHAASR